MEESRATFRQLSRGKHTYIFNEGNNENRGFDHRREFEEQQQQHQQNLRMVNRKLVTKRQPIRQDPRNSSALKSRKERMTSQTTQVVATSTTATTTTNIQGNTAATNQVDGEAKPEVREKTEEEIRQELEERENDIKKYEESIFYSPYYYDDNYEYRHVVLPKQLVKWIPHFGLLADAEWRSLGVKQSKGWEHYMIYAPEPHILLFKREINYHEKYGNEDSKGTKSKKEVEK